MRSGSINGAPGVTRRGLRVSTEPGCKLKKWFSFICNHHTSIVKKTRLETGVLSNNDSFY